MFFALFLAVVIGSACANSFVQPVPGQAARSLLVETQNGVLVHVDPTTALGKAAGPPVSGLNAVGQSIGAYDRVNRIFYTLGLFQHNDTHLNINLLGLDADSGAQKSMTTLFQLQSALVFISNHLAFNNKNGEVISYNFDASKKQYQILGVSPSSGTVRTIRAFNHSGQWSDWLGAPFAVDSERDVVAAGIAPKINGKFQLVLDMVSLSTGKSVASGNAITELHEVETLNYDPVSKAFYGIGFNSGVRALYKYSIQGSKVVATHVGDISGDYFFIVGADSAINPGVGLSCVLSTKSDPLQYYLVTLSLKDASVLHAPAIHGLKVTPYALEYL